MNSTQIPDNIGGPDPRWFGLVNDTNFYAPQSRVKARVIKAQAGVPQGHVLVRDMNTPNDIMIDDDEEVNLAEGNIFFSREPARCRTGRPTGEPKLGWLVNDRPEQTILANQTGQSLADLFSLSPGVKLYRDYESPRDELIAPEDRITFAQGPVFYTRGEECGPQEITIFVNTEPKKVRQTEITYEEILALAYETPPTGTDVHFTVNYRKGPPENPTGLLVENGAPVKLKEGMRFDVTANDRS